MNIEKPAVTAQDNDAPNPAGQPSCACRPRSCRRCILLLLLVLIVAGVGGGYWWGFTRIYHLDVCQSSMKTIQADKVVQQELGEPIQVANWPPPSPRIEEREQDIRWSIQGPKGQAKAHVHARLMMGKWEADVLEVTLPSGKKRSLAEAGEGDAPIFNAPKPSTKPPAPKGPAPDINLPVPPAEQ